MMKIHYVYLVDLLIFKFWSFSIQKKISMHEKCVVYSKSVEKFK